MPGRGETAPDTQQVPHIRAKGPRMALYHHMHHFQMESLHVCIPVLAGRCMACSAAITELVFATSQVQEPLDNEVIPYYLRYAPSCRHLDSPQA